MKVPGTISIVTILVACGGNPPHGEPAAQADPVWRERVAKAFELLSKESLHPADPAILAAAGWHELGVQSPQALSGDALADGVAARIASQQITADRAWRVVGALVDAADNGHTVLFSPDALKQIMDSISGQPFTAPGLVVEWDPDRRLVVTDVLPGGPAAEAGVAVGDVITAVNGKRPASTWSVGAAEFVPVGSATSLSIDRDGARRDVTYRNALYQHPVSSHRIAGAIGIVKPYFFSIAKNSQWDTTELVRAALADFDRADVRGIVIDVRGNQGGNSCGRVASLFTDAEPMLLTVPRWQERGKPGAKPPMPWPNAHNAWPIHRPVAVLIDEQSTSCAEMAALMLREHVGARVFGQPSGGDLDLPAHDDLGDGYELWIPDAPVIAPRGLDAPPAARIEPDETIPNRTIGDLRAGRDLQLDAAMQWLAAQTKSNH